MRRPFARATSLTALLVTVSMSGGAAAAQTLSSRPVTFGDPVPGIDPQQGELVLGVTTLTAALRIFAVELQDSIRLPRAHGSNPELLPTRQISVGGLTIRPRHRLDLGPERYTLYFDANERLIAALEEPLRSRPLRREELVARYPTLRVDRRWHTAEGVPTYDGLVAPLVPCVSLTAGAWLPAGGVVELMGYVYTCSTKPVRVTRPRE